MPVCTVVEYNLISEKKVILIIGSVIYFFDDVPDSFASPSQTVLRVFQHDLAQYIPLDYPNFCHKILFFFLSKANKWVDKFFEI